MVLIQLTKYDYVFHPEDLSRKSSTLVFSDILAMQGISISLKTNPLITMLFNYIIENLF